MEHLDGDGGGPIGRLGARFNRPRHDAEELVSCRYSLRPWVIRNLLRTEIIIGVFKLRKDGVKRNVRFLYDAG